MKKLLSATLIAMLCFVLCACSQSSSTYSVVSEDGSTYKVTADEIFNAKENNSIEYEEKYEGATISGKGKITKIVDDAEHAGSYIPVHYYTVTLDSQVEVAIKQTEFDETGYTIGDNVNFVGELNIYDAGILYVHNFDQPPIF